jgi:hypothetical protein
VETTSGFHGFFVSNIIILKKAVTAHGLFLRIN